MAEANQQIDVAAITKTVTDAVLASIKPSLDAVDKLAGTVSDQGKNIQVLADTLKNAPPAKEGDADPNAPKPLTAEDVTKLLDARDQQKQATAEQKAARDAFIANPENGVAKLPDAYKAQLGNDPARWADEAKAAKSSWEKFVKDSGIQIPDVGGDAARGTGEPPAGQTNKAAPVNTGGLPDGLAKFAAEVQTQVDTAKATQQQKAATAAA